MEFYNTIMDNGLLFFVVMMAFTGIVNMYLKTTFNRYKKVRSSMGMTGAEVARRILDNNGLYDVSLSESPGKLSDHYDPKSRSVRLSRDIYHGSSVAAVAVAAHECGHAIQHANSYVPLNVRSALVPAVNIGSRLGTWLIMIGLFIGAFNLAGIGIILFATIVVFQLVTLPVEFNASNRAMDLLTDMKILHDNSERRGARKVLNAAALTYVAALIVSVLELIRLMRIVARNRD